MAYLKTSQHINSIGSTTATQLTQMATISVTTSASKYTDEGIQRCLLNIDLIYAAGPMRKNVHPTPKIEPKV